MIRSNEADPAAKLPTYTDVQAAAQRLQGQAVRTPLLESPALNDRVGGRILLKAETLQRTGSFKFRGAFNRISQIPEADRAGGVVAYSSGNHAQGVAAAAQLLGLPATIATFALVIAATAASYFFGGPVVALAEAPRLALFQAFVAGSLVHVVAFGVSHRHERDEPFVPADNWGFRAGILLGMFVVFAVPHLH